LELGHLNSSGLSKKSLSPSKASTPIDTIHLFSIVLTGSRVSHSDSIFKALAKPTREISVMDLSFLGQPRILRS
jgi:hypothetical protein